MKTQTILALTLLALCTGCASITRGTKDSFAVETDPNGASATLSSGQTCTTPCALILPRKHSFTVTIEKDGYKPVTANVVPRQSGAGSAGMAGNLLLGGLIGAAVDAGSGAMKDLFPNPLIVKMEKVDSNLDSKVMLPEGEALPDEEVVEGDMQDGSEQ